MEHIVKSEEWFEDWRLKCEESKREGNPPGSLTKRKTARNKESGIGLAGSFFFDKFYVCEGVFNKEFVINTYGSR
jgi:hypothetical protein